MSAEGWIGLLSPLIVAGIGGLVALLVAKTNKRGTNENALIDQLQEEIARVDGKLDESLKRERIRDNYIHQLRDHIVQEKPPPPPEWPEGLTR